MTLAKLLPQDIDEKIRLNEVDGVNIYKLRDSINEELKEFSWIIIRSQAQCQSYKEQLEHIDKRILEIEKAKQGV